MVSRTSGFDTWAELERAAGERYWDGMTLAADPEGRHCGAVYLWGYVAEMLLKVAYYRVREVSSGDDLQAELTGMRDRARALGFSWHGNLHNLDDLVLLLIEERRARGLVMSPPLAVELQGHVDVLVAHWAETLRYKEEKATPQETAEVLDSIDWLWANWSSLWS